MMRGLQAWIRTAPDVPALASLGVREPGDFLGASWDSISGTTLARGERVGLRDGVEEIRYPLPGTPDENGRLRERPMGAGTGWLRLFRWSRGGPRLWRARFSAPRSTSLAEHAWNVMCHAQAAGVGVPELVAVGAAGRGLVARESFLITREPDRSIPLPEWVEWPRDEGMTERGLRSLAAAAERLAAAGVSLAQLEPGDVWIERPRAGCGEVVPAAAERNRLPGVLITRFTGARLVGAGDARVRRAALEVMDRALGDGAVSRAAAQLTS